MEARPAVYEPPFERYFIRQLSDQFRLETQVPEALQQLQRFYIQRHLFAAQVMEQGRGLLRGWAAGPEAKLVEARAVLEPLTGEVGFQWWRKSDVNIYPLNRFKRMVMKLRYYSHDPITYPNPPLEELTFTYSQGSKRRKIELDFTEGTSVRTSVKGDSLSYGDFEVMQQLALAVNLFSGVVHGRESQPREDYSLGAGVGIVVSFPSQVSKEAKAA